MDLNVLARGQPWTNPLLAALSRVTSGICGNPIATMRLIDPWADSGSVDGCVGVGEGDADWVDIDSGRLHQEPARFQWSMPCRLAGAWELTPVLVGEAQPTAAR